MAAFRFQTGLLTFKPRTQYCRPAVLINRRFNHFRILRYGLAGKFVSCSSSNSDTAPSWEDLKSGDEFPDLVDYIKLNNGLWKGHYTQYHFSGDVVHSIPLETVGETVGKGEDSSLRQKIQVRVPSSINENEMKDVELKDINRFTVNESQQLCFFKREAASALSHQTAEVIDKVLRIGIVGSIDESNQFPIGVKLPSSRPALVSESCLYSGDKSERIRAFHVLDPRGVIDTIGLFRELRSDASDSSQELQDFSVNDLLGEWRGAGQVVRSDLYGGSTVQQESRIVYSMDSESVLKQETSAIIGGVLRSMILEATINGRLLLFKGFQTTLLPHGIMLSCPSVVKRGQAFAFECCWMHSSEKRQRLQRTFDSDGMVVSTGLFVETKQ